MLRGSSGQRLSWGQFDGMLHPDEEVIVYRHLDPVRYTAELRKKA
jgi:hypothetical protein